MLTEFLATKKFPGQIFFAKVWGSRSHNTNLPDSDWDFSGVYMTSLRDVLGLSPPAETVQNKEGQEKPDYSFHEVGKFCNLLLTGNPGIVEMLFTDRMCVSTPEWDVLRENRRRFLSQRTTAQYVGYALGQLKRLRAGNYLHTTGGGYNEKWAYHLLRLLGDARRIVDGGEPVVWKEGPEQEFLMSVRHDKVSRDEVERIADEQINFIAANEHSLPPTGDKEFLNDWLVDLRLKNGKV